MSRDEILAMPAGREINALIAKNVIKSRRVKHYSTDIAAAWEVMEAMRKNGVLSEYDSRFGYRFVFWDYTKNPQRPFEATAETAPLAICRAALLAMMEIK